MLNQHEIKETLHMIDREHLDIRTITMGVSLRSCAHPDPKIAAQKMYDKICKSAERLVPVGDADAMAREVLRVLGDQSLSAVCRLLPVYRI